MQRKIFSIIQQRDKGVCHIGTGFLISENGGFMSAGHVFKGKEVDTLRALFLEKNDRGETTYDVFEFDASIEINYNTNNSSGLYEDSAKGKLIGIQNKNYLGISNNIPSIGGAKLNSYYYRSARDIDNSPFPLAENFETIKSKLVTDMFGLFFESRGHNIVPDYTVNKQKYNNITTCSVGLIKGASGCPMINVDGDCVGIHIGAEKENLKMLHVPKLL